MNTKNTWQQILVLVIVTDLLAYLSFLLVSIPFEDSTRPKDDESLTKELTSKEGITEKETKTEKKVDEYEKPKYVIHITPQEIDMLVQLVQHEVGTSASYYPGYDFDYIQQCMAKLVINRVQHSNFPKSVSEVIKQKGQFENWKRCFKFSPTHERTRRNVEFVLFGNDQISDKLLFQMSFTNSSIKRNIKRMKRKVGPIKAYHTAVSADKRHIIFATTK